MVQRFVFSSRVVFSHRQDVGLEARKKTGPTTQADFTRVFAVFESAIGARDVFVAVGSKLAF